METRMTAQGVASVRPRTGAANRGRAAIVLAAAMVAAAAIAKPPEPSPKAVNFVKHFAWDLPKAQAQVLTAAQGPINAAAFGTKVSQVAWKTKPSWFIVARKDQAIAPDEERFFAKRMKAKTTELDTSHLPMLSKPNEVAAVIVDAATKASKESRKN
jgi:pimeloyl-ACP methyl ester carboxylesterase